MSEVSLASSETAVVGRTPLPPGFLLRHGLIPWLLFAIAVALIHWLKADWTLASELYTLEGGRWTLRHAFVTERLLHTFGHTLSIAAWIGVLAAWLLSFRRPRLRRWRRPLGYLLLAVALSALSVSAVKATSNMDCPWDMKGLGGDRPALSLYEPRPAGLPRGRCFPAGHASGGYAWMSLYFALLMIRPQRRWYGLAVGLGVGMIFGIDQQLRGAHFLSHDLWTAGITWTVALLLYLRLAPARAPPEPSI